MNTAKATLAAIILSLTPCALAQPADPPPADRQTQADERAALRERLARHIEDTRAKLDELERAVAALDRGEPVDDVRRAVVEDRVGAWRERREERRGGREGRPQRPGQPARDAEPSPETIDRILDFTRRHNPDIADDLEALRETDPEAFRDKIAQIAPRLEHMMRKAQDRPEKFRIMSDFRESEHRAHELARRIADAEPAVAEDLTVQLKDLIAQGFDARLRLNEIEIEEAREHLDSLASRADQWATDRDKMIQERTMDLISRALAGELEMPRRHRDLRNDRDRRENARPGERRRPRPE